ncbi:MAG: GGDEF domain-containing protein [Leucothrix sp.]
MTSIQVVCIGMLFFINKEIDIHLRILLLALFILFLIVLLQVKEGFLAPFLFSGYLAVSSLSTSVTVWRCKESPPLLKLSGIFLFLIGLHWLDFPIMGSVDWFVPIGFLLGLILAIGLYFSLAAVAVLQFKEITTKSEKKAIYAATHDPLTGVYNRSHLPTLFDKYKRNAHDSKGTFIMLYLDLDGFKSVNDKHGHKAGDAVLLAVAKRLESWLGKKGDVVRIGGDEMVVFNALRSDASANIIYGTSAAQSILKLIEKPIVDGSSVYSVSASIGGCYYDSQLGELETMLHRADELMFKAKEAGKRRVYFGNIPDDDPFATEQLSEAATTTSY